VGSGDRSGGSGCRDEVSLCAMVLMQAYWGVGRFLGEELVLRALLCCYRCSCCCFLSWLASVDLRWRSSSSGTRGALVIGGCGSAEWYRGLTSTLPLNEYVGFLICCCLMGFGCRRSVRTPSVAGLHASHLCRTCSRIVLTKSVVG
jgi:hypothetical protein